MQHFGKISNYRPYLGYIIQQSELSRNVNFQKTINYNTSQGKRYDVAVTYEVGISIPFVLKYKFSLEVGNNLGLINIRALIVFNNGTFKTNSINFPLGLIH
jgi:hypothetical protein